MANARNFTVASLSLVTALAIAACGGDDDGDAAADSTLDPNADLTQQSLVVSNWEAYMPEDLPKRFEKEVGADVEVTYHATNEEIVGKLTASDDSGIDVAFVSGQFAQALNEQGLLEPIDPELVPNLSNLYSEASELAYDPGNEFSVPYAWGTTGLCYREDLTGYDPTSWNDLLDPRPEVEGKTTMLATERWLMLPAQKALGYSVNTTDEAEMEEVKNQLLETKPTLLAFDDTTFYKRLVNGEASLVQAWDGWCNYGIAKDDRIKFVVPEEGSDIWADTMVILKSSENKEAAHAFINYILDPKVHSWVVENILYKVPNQAAMEMIDPELVESFPNLGMTPSELLEQEELVDLGEDAPMYTEIATEVTAAN
ncbi:MAG TPA: spermidine/putrescine ABC transporter substrate-binding protein [Actinomycetes bacterium]|nr:spermidine/putrescine ABC transporter substrate-binding protein [Actinomycetes bacterium]